MTLPTSSSGSCATTRAFPPPICGADARYLAAARSHWELGARRAAGRGPRPRAHAFAGDRGLGRAAHVVEIVNDDMPFLVDSVTMELDRHDLGMHLVGAPDRARACGTPTAAAPDSRAPRLRRGHRSCSSRSSTSRSTARPVAEVLDAVDRRSRTRLWTTCVPRPPTGSKMLDALRHVVDEHRRATAADRSRRPRRRARAARVDGRPALHVPRLPRATTSCRGDGDDVLRRSQERRWASCATRPSEPSASFASLPPEDPRPARTTARCSCSPRRTAARRCTARRTSTTSACGDSTHDGEVIGEHRFLGLFTSSAYNSNPIDVPVLRRKVAAVVDRAGFLPASHDQKDLHRDPRDVPARRPVPDRRRARCSTNAMGILRLQERRQVRMFVHREIYGRFVSCIVYLPARPVHDAGARRASRRSSPRRSARAATSGTSRLGESVLARLHFVLHVDPRRPGHRSTSTSSKRGSRRPRRAWIDDLRDTLVTARGEEDGARLLRSMVRRVPGRVPRRLRRARRRSPISRPLQDLDDADGLAARLYNGTGQRCRPEAVRRGRAAVALRRAPEPDEHGRRRRSTSARTTSSAARPRAALDQALPAAGRPSTASSTGSVGRACSRTRSSRC